MRGLKTTVKQVIPGSQRARMRRMWARFLRARMRGSLSKEEFLDVLTERLGVKQGSTLLIHCSFGNLKADFSPKDAVSMLMDLVGANGNILMPFYPGAGIEALEKRMVFDPRSSDISTGALAKALAARDASRISLHPIKAVVGWGRDRDSLLSQHSQSRTPYDEFSPYFKMLESDDVLCLGLGTEKNSFIHACEDNISGHPMHQYSPKEWDGHCVTEAGDSVVVKTLVHRMDCEWLMGSAAFLTQTRCPSYLNISYRGRVFYRANALAVFDHMRRLSGDGIFRIRKG